MADLNYIDRDSEVKIVGQNATGDSVNYVSADVNGNMFVKDYSNGPVTAGTAAPVSSLIGGQFNTVLPTLTNTQQSAIQLDSTGRLIVSPTTQGPLAEDHNYGTVGATTLRTASQIGNATGAALFGAGTTTAQVLRVVLPTDQTSIPAAQSGAWTTGRTWTLSSGTDSINSVYVDVAPANQTVTVLDTGTSSLTGANGQVFYFGTPTAGSAVTYTLSSVEAVTIQGNFLGTGTLVVEVSFDGGTFWFRPNIYQISTQSYTNAFTGPFVGVLNTAGIGLLRIRTITSWTGSATVIVKETLNARPITIGDALPPGANVVGGVTQSGTWTVNAHLQDNTGSAITLGQKVMASSVPVVIASDQTAIPASQSGTWTVKAQLQDSSGSGSIAALNATVAAITTGCSTASFTVLGTWVATLLFEGTSDGTNWETINGTIVALDVVTQFIQTNQSISIPCGGFSQVRLRASAYTSGTANVTWNAGVGLIAVSVFNNVASALNAQVVGNVASGSADSGNAVKVGGVFNSSFPTLTTGQRGDIQLDSNSRQITAPITFFDKNSSDNITALNDTVIAITNGCASVTFDVTGTWVATITIQATTGDGNWFTVNGDVDITDSIMSSFTTNTFVTVPCGSFPQVRLIATAFTSGTAIVNWNAGAGGNVIEVFNTTPASLFVTSVPVDGQKATYSATSSIAFANALLATDIFTITGSATKTVKVLRIGFSCQQTTAGVQNIVLVKRSTANTAGSFSVSIAVPHDSTDAAATATVVTYTANPTLGTSVGNVRAARVFIPTAGTDLSTFVYDFNFGTLPEKAITLRGTTQVLALNLNGATVTGGTWTCFVEWTEE